MRLAIGVSCGIRGHYALMYDRDEMKAVRASPVSHRSKEGAEHEAREWALSEGLPCDCTQPMEEAK